MGDLDVDVEEEALGSRRLVSLLRYWQSKCAPDLAMAPRAVIDPGDIKSLLPIVLLANAAPHPSIRLLGTEATQAYGREMRDRDVREFELGEFQDQWLRAFDLGITLRRPVASAGQILRATELWDIEVLLMPLCSPTGAFTQLLGGLELRRAPFKGLGLTPATVLNREYTPPNGIGATRLTKI